MKRKIFSVLFALVLVLAFSLMPAMVAEAAQRTVTSLADDGLAGTLRAEIDGAGAGDEIVFDSSIVPGTIFLEVARGHLLIDKDIIITGPGAGSLSISGQNLTRVFNIASGNIVIISGVTITGGRTADGSTGGSPSGPGGDGSPGGGIYNEGTLTLTSCTVSNNTTGRGGNGGPGYNISTGGSGGAGGAGSGIYNEGTLTLTNSTVSTNTTGNGGHGGNGDLGWGGNGGSGGSGSGICSAGVLTLTNSTVSTNTTGSGGNGGSTEISPGSYGGSGGSGSGIYSAGTLTLTNSTVSTNTTGNGGNGGLSVLTLGGSGGSGGSGSGIYSASTLTLTNSTVSNNTTGSGGAGGDGNPPGGGGLGGSGGGIYNANAVESGNSIIANNTVATLVFPGSGPDFYGSLTSNGCNLIGDIAYCTISGDETGNIYNEDPMLGPLADNGGPTQTHALQMGSPAIDGVLSGYCTLDVDQRGEPRPMDGDYDGSSLCDMGAYEAPGPPPPLAVGGVVFPVSKLGLLAPWLALAVVIVAGGIILVRRRAHS